MTLRIGKDEFPMNARATFGIVKCCSNHLTKELNA